MTQLRRIQHVALSTVALFAALSAVGGGIAMLIGVIEFPLDWLRGSLFHSYAIPAVVLVMVVGGSQSIAAVALSRREGWGLEAVAVAGMIMMGWIVGEIVIVGSEPGLMRTLQAIYFTLGMFEAVLAGKALTTRTNAV